MESIRERRNVNPKAFSFIEVILTALIPAVNFLPQLIHPFFEKTYKDFMSNIVDHEEDDLKLKDAIRKLSCKNGFLHA